MPSNSQLDSALIPDQWFPLKYNGDKSTLCFNIYFCSGREVKEAIKAKEAKYAGSNIVSPPSKRTPKRNHHKRVRVSDNGRPLEGENHPDIQFYELSSSGSYTKEDIKDITSLLLALTEVFARMRNKENFISSDMAYDDGHENALQRARKELKIIFEEEPTAKSRLYVDVRQTLYDQYRECLQPCKIISRGFRNEVISICDHPWTVTSLARKRKRSTGMHPRVVKITGGSGSTNPFKTRRTGIHGSGFKLERRPKLARQGGLGSTSKRLFSSSSPVGPPLDLYGDLPEPSSKKRRCGSGNACGNSPLKGASASPGKSPELRSRAGLCPYDRPGGEYFAGGGADLLATSPRTCLSFAPNPQKDEFASPQRSTGKTPSTPPLRRSLLFAGGVDPAALAPCLNPNTLISNSNTALHG